MVRRIQGAILTGGASRRMGDDKALLRVGSSTLLGISFQALVDAGVSNPLVVGGDLERYRASIGHLQGLEDAYPGEGPLGGVITVLRRLSEDEVVVVLACDLPGVCAESVGSVVEGLMSNPRAAVALPVNDGRMEPLHAAWRASALPVLEGLFADGIRSMHSALQALELELVTGLDQSWLRNANTREDLM